MEPVSSVLYSIVLLSYPINMATLTGGFMIFLSGYIVIRQRYNEIK
ncbi:MAG: hypothetical protein H7844_11900 [Nitrospirae bacterium YQR-1]